MIFLCLFSISFAEEKAPIQENVYRPEISKRDEKNDDFPQFLFFKEITQQEYDQGIRLMNKLKDLIKADKLIRKKDYSEEINFVKDEFIPFVRTLKTVDEKEAAIRVGTLYMLLGVIFRLDSSQRNDKDIIELKDWMEKQKLERFGVLFFKDITKEQYARGSELSIRYFDIINSGKMFKKRQLTEEINFVKNECIPFVHSLKPSNERGKKVQMDNLEMFEEMIFRFECLNKDSNDKNNDLPRFLFFKEITKQEYDRGIQLMSKLEDLMQDDKLLKKKDCSEEIHFIKNKFIPFIQALKTIDEEEVEIKITAIQEMSYLVVMLDSSQEQNKDIIELKNWLEKQKLESFGVLSFKNITKEQHNRGKELIIKNFDIVHDMIRDAKSAQYVKAINYIKEKCIPFVNSLKPFNEEEKKLQLNTLKSFKRKIFIFECLKKEASNRDRKKDDLPQFLFFKEITKQQYDKGMQLMNKLRFFVHADEFLTKKDFSEEINFIKSEFIPFIRTLKIVDEEEAGIRIQTLHKLLSYVFRLDPSQEKSKDVIEIEDWIKKQGLERLAVISFKNITKEQYDRGVKLSIKYFDIVNNLKELARQKKQFTKEINFVKNECIPFVRSLKPSDEAEKKIQIDVLEALEMRISIFECVEKASDKKQANKP